MFEELDLKIGEAKGEKSPLTTITVKPCTKICTVTQKTNCGTCG
ncbi:MAG TPA: hypothetical protein VMH02_04295 [Verrucomicrobiae bacterium]|nr:hypothetical protein [Verrucomicrobiae bacterium]